MGITETARQRIRDDLLMENNYSTPDEILDYLRDENNFRSLSSLLKDTMIEAKVCDKTADDSEFVKVLTDLLVKLEKECSKETDKEIKSDDKRRTVSRWFSGEVSGINDFETAIKICFALGLDLKQTNTFLNKCGLCSLSIRKAEDSVYYYFLLQNDGKTKKSFADAHELIERYKQTEITEIDNSDQDKKKKTNSSTTITMLDNLKDTDWESDDAFLKSFLIPNTTKFINYSKSALLEYYKAKNMLFITAILYKVRNEEQPIINDYEALKLQNKTKVMTEEDSQLHIQFALRSALGKYKELKNNAEIIKTYKNECKFSDLEKSFLNKKENDPVAEKLCEIYRNIIYKDLGNDHIYTNEDDNDVFNRINTETYQSLLSLKKHIFASDAIESHIIISHVLSDICSPMDIYKSTLNVLIRPGSNEDDLISLGKDGVISGTLLTRKVFSKFESDPSIKTKKQSIDINHKMIIMMYYLLFSLEKFRKDFGDDDINIKDNQFVFPDCTFISFIDVVNGTLEKCCLPILYLPNQFDCAIVMSIRKFETANSSNEYLNTPFDFFNELLRLILIDSDIVTTDDPYWEKELWDEDKE